MDKEKRIREQAYHLWVAEGRPHGRHDEHWQQAAKLVAAEGAADRGVADPQPRSAAKPEPKPKPKLGKKASPVKKAKGLDKPKKKKPSKKAL
jgi:hypothetical protein